MIAVQVGTWNQGNWHRTALPDFVVRYFLFFLHFFFVAKTDRIKLNGGYGNFYGASLKNSNKKNITCSVFQSNINRSVSVG
jgi:hypothetical protein